MGHTIALALAAAVYPTILAGVIVILAQPRTRQLLLGFLLGGMTISILAGIAVVVVLEQTNKTISVQTTTRPVLDTVVGVGSLVLAWAVWTGHTGRLERRRARRKPKAEPAKEPWTQRVLGRGSIWLAVAAGALLNLPGVWYIAALTDIAEDKPRSYQLAQILVFNLIMFLLVEIPLLMYLVNEESAKRRVDEFSAWGHRHTRELGAGVAALVGVYLVAKAANAVF